MHVLCEIYCMCFISGESLTIADIVEKTGRSLQKMAVSDNSNNSQVRPVTNNQNVTQEQNSTKTIQDPEDGSCFTIQHSIK